MTPWRQVSLSPLPSSTNEGDEMHSPLIIPLTLRISLLSLLAWLYLPLFCARADESTDVSWYEGTVPYHQPAVALRGGTAARAPPRQPAPFKSSQAHTTITESHQMVNQHSILHSVMQYYAYWSTILHCQYDLLNGVLCRQTDSLTTYTNKKAVLGMKDITQ